MTAFTSFMARRTHAANTRLEMIEISLRELGTGQRTIITEITKPMASALPSPSDLVPDSYPHKAGRGIQKGDVSLIRTAMVRPGITPSSGETADRQDIARINASLSHECQCDPWCACLCHKRQRWQMPMSLQSVLGDLSIGYSGALFSRTACTEIMCRRPSAQNTKFVYRLPPWLAARVIMAELGGPSPSLRAGRIVERNAPIMHYSRIGDVEV